MASSCASRNYTNAGRSISSPKGTTLKVDVLRSRELFRVRFSVPSPRTLDHTKYALHCLLKRIASRIWHLRLGPQDVLRRH
ncbi:hypothetical protein TNCV_4925831 [Trichonephila clavipes]|nr:hypothetical protein TNCV_4925831 [Trichonephila clavipes]